MYLGVQGLMPRELRDVTPETMAIVRRHGFTGVACRYYDPLAVTERDAKRLGASGGAVRLGHGLRDSIARRNGCAHSSGCEQARDCDDERASEHQLPCPESRLAAA